MFDKENYNVIVLEEIGLYFIILIVFAFDGDEGINVEVYYSFVLKTNFFVIYLLSGAVIVIRLLNFYEKLVYYLVVIV